MKYVFQLSYMSKSNEPFTNDKLEEMLIHARQKNARLGISGLLIYNKGVFLQLLEGEEAPTSQLYDTIRQDSRHHDVHAFFENYTPKRMFENWSMAYQNTDLYQPETVQRLHTLIHQFHNTDIVATRTEWVSILQAMRYEL
jgi:hypothetical protein